MKTITRFPLLLSALMIVSSSFAQDIATEKPERPAHRQGGVSRGKGADNSRLLQHLLQMDDAQLANIRQTVERIEKMPPEERTKMRERIGKMQNMPPEKVEAMRAKFKAIPPEQRDAMRQRWMEMPHEERKEWRSKLKAMTPEERKAAFEEQGFLAPPPNRDKKGPRASKNMGPQKQHQRGPAADPKE